MQSGFSQKNLITVTPIKPAFDKLDLRYERVLSERLSVSVKVQFWFIEKKKAERAAWLLHAPSKIERNKGQRYSLNLRFALINKTEKTHRLRCYIAGELFRGKHHIMKRREAYSHSTLGILRPTITKSEGAKHGELDLVSSGIAVGGGWQFIFKEQLVIDFGIRASRAYINNGIKEMKLEAQRPGDEDLYVGFEQDMNSKFLEPHLSIGIAF